VTHLDPATGKPRRMTTAERQEETCAVTTRYQAGESIRHIAAAPGRSYGTVHRRLCEAGVFRRPRGRNHRTNTTPTGPGQADRTSFAMERQRRRA
jgi:hypothetical protein